VIEVENISKTLADVQVLKRVTLQLATNQTHVLLGQSGSGKSTLLRLMAGLIEPDSGSIKFNANLMNRNSQRELSRQIGFVTQQGGLFPHLTAQENVTLVARTLKWQKQKVATRLDELLDVFAIGPELLGHRPAELSGGERQRVSIMRASFMNPQFMLLDEPLAALDPIIRRKLQSEMKRIFNRLKKTVVLVTHDVGEAAYFGHTIAVLRGGEILQHGPFEELVNKPVDPYLTEFFNAQRSWSDYV
jgi:osmoprotectant transport system ATP-binding protein